MAESSALQVERRGDVVIFTVQEPKLRGDSLAEAMRTEMLAALAAGNVAGVIVDLHKVELVTSVAFRPLLSLRRKLTEMGDGRVVLCGLSPFVAEVFRVTRLISSSGASQAPFDVRPDVASALDSLASP